MSKTKPGGGNKIGESSIVEQTSIVRLPNTFDKDGTIVTYR